MNSDSLNKIILSIQARIQRMILEKQNGNEIAGHVGI